MNVLHFLRGLDSSKIVCLIAGLIDKLTDLYDSVFISVLKQKYNCDKCKELPSDLDSRFNIMFNIIQHAFHNFSTEHKTLRYFDNLSILIKLQLIIVDAFRFVDGRRQVVSNAEIQVIQKSF